MNRYAPLNCCTSNFNNVTIRDEASSDNDDDDDKNDDDDDTGDDNTSNVVMCYSFRERFISYMLL